MLALEISDARSGVIACSARQAWPSTEPCESSAVGDDMLQSAPVTYNHSRPALIQNTAVGPGHQLPIHALARDTKHRGQLRLRNT